MRKNLLHAAVVLQRDDVIRYLVSKRANVNIVNSKDKTAMQCIDEDTSSQIMQGLLSRSVLHVSL